MLGTTFTKFKTTANRLNKKCTTRLAVISNDQIDWQKFCSQELKEESSRTGKSLPNHKSASARRHANLTKIFYKAVIHSSIPYYYS